MDLIEGSELPQICHKCLGRNKNNRMIRDAAGSECRLCTRPFATFRWKLIDPPITKQTLICKPCASDLNACQSCILDLDFQISLTLRDTALKIMVEEGGSDEDRVAVLEAIKESFSRTSSRDAQHSPSRKNSPDLHELVAQLPLPGSRRPENCRTLCVYGIEKDLDPSVLRSFFNASISKVEYVPAGRYAFFQFSNETDLPQLESNEAILDGRRLLFAWGERVNIPSNLHSSMSAIIRAYLQSVI